MEVNRTNKDMIMSIHVYQTDPFRVMKNSESHFFPYHGHIGERIFSLLHGKIKVRDLTPV